MGSHLQPMTFIFDTGSSWLWVPSDACPKTQCAGNTYHYGSSNNYVATTNTYTITYGKGQVKGYIVQDFVSLNSNGTLNTTKARLLSIY